MRSFLLDQSTVFCLSSNGVMEGHHFLTLVSHNPCRDATKRRRRRTFSLPSLIDTSYDRKGKKLTRSWRSLSDDTLQRSADVCFDCVTKLGVSQRKRRDGNAIKRRRIGRSQQRRRSPKINSSKKSSISYPHQHLRSSCPAVMFWMDGYLLSYFVAELKRSSVFRSLIISRYNTFHTPTTLEGYPLLIFVVVMSPPNKQALDLLGNKMVNSNILYRRSLEHALSWLSTLGGAFSALGDLSPSWAEEAGHVSITQLRIAMKLGDPGIQSRCRLYAAISLLQRGYLKSCRDIVRQEYSYAMSSAESDPRLRRMCLGVWAKLQYHWNLVAKTNKSMLKLSCQDGLDHLSSNSKYRNVYDLEEGRRIARNVDSGS